MSRPPAFIHLDCDGLWAVRSCYGPAQRPDPAGDPLWLEGIPAALDLLDEVGLPATLFVIGADLQIDAHRDLVRQAQDRGHEIASHGMTHAMDLRSAPPETLRDEIAKSRLAIQEVTGTPPAGFRAPGFSFRPALLRQVLEAGHLYDSSLFPSPWGPMLRTARRLLGSGGRDRQMPYGGWRDGWRSRAPQRIETDQGPLMEIPVSLTPHLRLPAHASFAMLRSDAKIDRVVRWHARHGLPFVWVMHLIDLCDTREIDLPTPRWARRLFHRGAEEKRARLRRVLTTISEQFEVCRTDRWVISELNRL